MVDRGTFSVRQAAGEDAQGILYCLSRAFEPFRNEYTAEGFIDTVLTRETLLDRLRLMSVFVAVTETGHIIGTVSCVALGAGEGHLRGMAVLPEWHGSGVGRILLEAAESELRRKKCTYVTLDTTEPLRGAVRFYEKHGYRPSGKVGDFFGMRLFEHVKRLEKSRESA